MVLDVCPSLTQTHCRDLTDVTLAGASLTDSIAWVCYTPGNIFTQARAPVSQQALVSSGSHMSEPSLVLKRPC